MIPESRIKQYLRKGRRSEKRDEASRLAILFGSHGGPINTILNEGIDVDNISDGEIKDIVNKMVNIIETSLRPLEVDLNKEIYAILNSGRLR